MAVHTITDQEFKEKVKAHPKVVVKYYADWCGSCRIIAPKFRRFSEDERFKDIIFLDVNAEKNPEARHWAGVKNLPFFALAKDGELLEADCTSKEEKILEMIEKLHAA